MTNSFGLETHGGLLTAKLRPAENWEVIMRGEYMEGEMVGDSNISQEVFTPGVSYYIQGHSRIAMNYEMANEFNDHLLTFQLQYVL